VAEDEVDVFHEGDGVGYNGGQNVGGTDEIRGVTRRNKGQKGEWMQYEHTRVDLMQEGPAAKAWVRDLRTDTRIVSDAKRSIMMGRRRATWSRFPEP
jgi:hypothetical protein